MSSGAETPASVTEMTDDPVSSRLRAAWTWIDYSILALIVVLVVVPNAPGRINADTAAMLYEARTNTIGDWHSPLIQFGWRFADHVVPVSVLFACQVALMVVASAPV